MKYYKLIFDQLSQLNMRTMLLEACDWDEEKMEKALSQAAETSQELFESGGTNSWDQFKLIILQSLSIDFEPEVVEVMSKMIDQIVAAGVAPPSEKFEN